ncbi:hypothetical protein AZE42_13419, partial [Rhizopogon vesiculosus]
MPACTYRRSDYLHSL